MSAQSITDYILQNEENLRVAAAVYEAWPAARDQITQGFLQRLRSQLLKQLPGWQTDVWGTFYEEAYASFGLHKLAWKLEYYVNLQFRDFGENMRLGVVRDEELIPDRPFSAEVLAAVRKCQSAARQSKWWEAYILMRSPAKDWRPSETMWKMHTDNSFLEAVKEQMLAVAKAAEPILDGLTKSNKRSAK